MWETAISGGFKKAIPLIKFSLTFVILYLFQTCHFLFYSRNSLVHGEGEVYIPPPPKKGGHQKKRRRSGTDEEDDPEDEDFRL